MTESVKKTSDDQLDLYEALARVRDHAYAIGEVLDKLVQTKAKTVTKDYDVSKINWIQKTGTKGTYEYADLKAHNGKFQHLGMFYWVFRDAAGIGRKTVAK